MRFKPLAFLPALIFLGVAGAFYISLVDDKEANTLPSALIGKPAPQFELPPLHDGAPGLKTADLTAGQVTVVNVWASWCGPCRIEHPKLMRLAEMNVAQIVGINQKDAPEDARAFLNNLGDPFSRIGADRSGRAVIDWGVYGVPETFIVDGKGTIIYKHVGPIQNNDLENKILPMIEKARASS